MDTINRAGGERGRRPWRSPRLVVVALALGVLLSACSGGEEVDGSLPAAPETTDATPASVDTDPPGTDPPDPAANSFDFDTGGLVDYLDSSLPETGFSSEISLLFVAEDQVLVNLQTSFFEPEEAVALCEAIADFVDAAGGPGKIEFVSTSGADIASRASADSPCEAGDDL